VAGVLSEVKKHPCAASPPSYLPLASLLHSWQMSVDSHMTSATCLLCGNKFLGNSLLGQVFRRTASSASLSQLNINHQHSLSSTRRFFFVVHPKICATSFEQLLKFSKWPPAATSTIEGCSNLKLASSPIRDGEYWRLVLLS